MELVVVAEVLSACVSVEGDGDGAGLRRAVGTVVSVFVLSAVATEVGRASRLGLSLVSRATVVVGGLGVAALERFRGSGDPVRCMISVGSVRSSSAIRAAISIRC